MYKKEKINHKNQKLRSSSSSSDDSYDLKQITINKKVLLSQKNTNIFNPPYDSSWFETEINNSKNYSNSKISIQNYINKLFNICKTHLDTNVKTNTTKAIIVPHAGIRYSGLCSASAYYQLKLRTTPIKRIILFCTHHKSSNNIIAPSFTHIKPLLGNIPLKIDTKLIDELKPLLEINNSAFDEEHSFFNQLPFIETIISSNSNMNTSNSSNVLITPFLISNSMILNKTNCDKLHKAMDILKLLLSRKDTVLICTSDFSHINGHFETKITSNIQQNIRNQDNQILQFIYDNLNGVITKSKKIDDILFIQNAPSCGTMAMYLFAKLLNYHSGAKESSSSSSSSSSDESNKSINDTISKNNRYSKLLYPRISCYYTSQVRDKYIDIFDFYPEQLTSILPTDLNNNTSESSVSYVGIIFTSQPNIEDKNDKKKTIHKLENLLSQYEKQALLGFIKEYLFFKFSMPKYKIPNNLINPINTQSFKLNLGVGITVYKSSDLRNVANIIDNTINNTNDNDETKSIESKLRYLIDKLLNNNNTNTYKTLTFPALKPDEYNKLGFEISIFNKTEPITLNEFYTNKFNLGTDGIIIIDTNTKTKKQTSVQLLTPNSYSLTNIEKSLNPNISKKSLLEQLCNIQIQNERENTNNSKDCYKLSNIKLFYNEGFVFS